MVVVRTLGAPQRRLLRGRRPAVARDAEPTPVPTSRVTLVAAEPFSSPSAAEPWLAEMKSNRAERDAVAAADNRILNEVIHAYRLATGDPHTHEVAPRRALVVRVGYGSGDQVAEGRLSAALELPGVEEVPGGRRAHSSDERLVAMLAGREQPLVAEELILRARADIDGGRPREAALQCRIALEALIAEASRLPGGSAPAELEVHRATVAEAANAALHGPLPQPLEDGVAAAIAQMELLLRRRTA